MLCKSLIRKLCKQISAVTSRIADGVGSLGLAWQWSCLLLALAYFYSHYFFANNLSHVSAMFSAFLSVAIAAGKPLQCYTSIAP